MTISFSFCSFITADKFNNTLYKVTSCTMSLVKITMVKQNRVAHEGGWNCIETSTGRRDAQGCSVLPSCNLKFML